VNTEATWFMRQPFPVSGYLVTKENMAEIAKWCKGHVIEDDDRPFVRVPVDRPTNSKQTQAFIGTWVTLSTHLGEESFKVYTQEWLDKNFILIPREMSRPTEEKTPVEDNVRSFPVPQPRHTPAPPPETIAADVHNPPFVPPRVPGPTPTNKTQVQRIRPWRGRRPHTQ